MNTKKCHEMILTKFVNSTHPERNFFVCLFNTLYLIVNDDKNYCYCKKFGEKKDLPKKIVTCEKYQLFFKISKRN